MRWVNCLSGFQRSDIHAIKFRLLNGVERKALNLSSDDSTPLIGEATMISGISIWAGDKIRWVCCY